MNAALRDDLLSRVTRSRRASGMTGNRPLIAYVERLEEALAILRDALDFYEADPDVVGADTPWEYDYDRHRWYWKGLHPADVADFALRKASLAERGEGKPWDDYVGKAKRAALGLPPEPITQE